MNIIKSLVYFIILLLTNVYGQSSELGRVEWTDKGPIVYSKGIGAVNPQMPIAVQRPAVIEAAKIVGLRNVLEIIKGVNINSETTIENRMLTDDIIIKSAQGKIKNFSVGEPKYYSDGTVEIEIIVPLFKNKDLISTIIPMNSVGKKTLEKSETENEPYTGVIINCGSLPLLPALTVNVKDSNGKELYSPSIAKEDFIFQMEGMVGYTASINQAKELKDRVGNNPAIIDAVEVVGENHSDIIISTDDLNKILGNQKTISSLEECRVIFVSKNF